MLPLEIELDILEMRQTLLVGEDPHILHRRMVPDFPRTRRVICFMVGFEVDAAVVWRCRTQPRDSRSW
jgi:hypothetical protein